MSDYLTRKYNRIHAYTLTGLLLTYALLFTGLTANAFSVQGQVTLWDLVHIFTIEALILIPWGGIGLILVSYIRSGENRALPWYGRVGAHLVLLAGGLLLHTAFNYYTNLFFWGSSVNFVSDLLLFMDTRMLIYVLLFLSIVTIESFRRRELEEVVARERSAKLERARIRQAYNAVPLQLISTYLDHINAYLDTSPSTARELTIDFSDLLRELLYHSERLELRPEEDHKLLRKYMVLWELRVNRELPVRFQSDDHPGKPLAPPISILFPLMEFLLSEFRERIVRSTHEIIYRTEGGDPFSCRLLFRNLPLTGKECQMIRDSKEFVFVTDYLRHQYPYPARLNCNREGETLLLGLEIKKNERDRIFYKDNDHAIA